MPGPGALPGARTNLFEPLNAKKLERPASKLRVKNAECRMKMRPGILHFAFFTLHLCGGGELVEETNQGFAMVPIAQNTERECPKLQVAGESPAGDAISGLGWWSNGLLECWETAPTRSARYSIIPPIHHSISAGAWFTGNNRPSPFECRM